MALRKPMFGYPTKGDAIVALKDQGLTWEQIVEKVGGSLVSAKGAWHDARKRARSSAPLAGGDKRGIWTLAKIDKAKRLLGKTTIYIAEVLQVPPEELLKLYISGELPPIGETQRTAQLLQLAHDGQPMPQPPPPKEPPAPLAEPPAVPAVIEPDALPAPIGEPTREEDEAALAALEEEDRDAIDDPAGDDPGAGDAEGGTVAGGTPPIAPAVMAAVRVGRSRALDAGETEDEEEAGPEPEPDAAPAKRPLRYRLTDGAGRYLLDDPAKGMTLNRALAWCGAAADMEKLFKSRPSAKDLEPERVP